MILICILGFIATVAVIAGVAIAAGRFAGLQDHDLPRR